MTSVRATLGFTIAAVFLIPVPRGSVSRVPHEELTNGFVSAVAFEETSPSDLRHPNGFARSQCVVSSAGRPSRARAVQPRTAPRFHRVRARVVRRWSQEFRWAKAVPPASADRRPASSRHFSEMRFHTGGV